jgi:Tfp pilus assembly protein PilF
MAHFGLAEIDMSAGALPSAIDHYHQALAQDSTIVLYPNNLAFALIRAGRPNLAASVLVRALQRFPGEALLHKNLGLAQLRAGALAGAVEAFDSALDRDPALASAWGLRAEAKAKLHDLAGARSDWNTYLGMAHDESERPGIEAQLRRLGAL